jgi:transposase
MGVPRDSGIKEAVHGVESHLIAEKAQIQADNFNPQDHVLSFFWDRQGVLIVQFLPKSTAINAASYSETLTKLRRAIQNKRRGMLTRRVVLLHDNAWPHTAAQTQALITSFGWEQINHTHPPHSPDLAPSDFHLFLHLKKFLAGQRFDNDEDVKRAVQKWLSSQAATFYDEGIQNWYPITINASIMVETM